MKARGAPTYTVDTICWPMLKLEGTMVERVGVEFSAKDGGSFGSGVDFTFHKFDRDPDLSIRLSGWSDGISNILDERIQRVMRKVQRGEREHNLSVERLRRWLEAEGIMPNPEYMPGG